MQNNIQLYECKKLHAKITIGACEQNREKKTELKPIQCETCQDYLTWGKISVPSSKLPSPNLSINDTSTSKELKELTQFICPACGLVKKHHAKGLCQPCYIKQRKTLPTIQTKKVANISKCHTYKKCLKRLRQKNVCLQCKQEARSLNDSLSKILSNFMQVTPLEPNLEKMTKRFIDYAAESYRNMNV